MCGENPNRGRASPTISLYSFKRCVLGWLVIIYTQHHIFKSPCLFKCKASQGKVLIVGRNSCKYAENNMKQIYQFMQVAPVSLELEGLFLILFESRDEYLLGDLSTSFPIRALLCQQQHYYTCKTAVNLLWKLSLNEAPFL